MTFERSATTPFADDTVLSEAYIPNELRGRDNELNEVSEILQQIIDREEPFNSFIYGISGTGKTVSIKYKIQQLQKALSAYDDVHATFIYQNCESINSSYQAAIAIVNSFLRGSRDRPEDGITYDYLKNGLSTDKKALPTAGLPADRVYSLFFELLDLLTYKNTVYCSAVQNAVEKKNYPDLEDLTVTDIIGNKQSDSLQSILSNLHEQEGITPPGEVRDYVVVVLDEVDRIGTRDELLYEIPRSRANGRVDSVTPSVIGISNDIAYKESIKSKTDSSLRLKEITFKKYNVEELQEIITQRAELAFKSGAYDEAIIGFTAAIARKNGGDARYAIDLLQKAGVKAKQLEDTVVTETHINLADEEKRRDRVYEVVEDLNEHEKLLLAAIVYHNIHNETPISRTDLYPTYNQFANQLLDSANVSRRVADYLKEMSQLGLLTRENAYAGPGQSGFTYDIDRVDYELMIKILASANDRPGGLLPNKLKKAYERFINQQSRPQ